MTKAFEKENVTSRHVACDGGQGAEGHPKVYLEIAPDEKQVMCPYCSKTFVLKKAA